jgi:plasmid rolling circle replication initiator protein Rep
MIDQIAARAEAGAPSFTRYLRDNSDLYLRDNSDFENVANPFSDQSKCEFFGVDESVSATATEPEYLSEWSPRDKPWDQHRADADQIAHIYGAHQGFQKLGTRVSSCSLRLGFAWAPDREDPKTLTLKLRDAWFCRVRHCPICQWRRVLMWSARFQTSLPRIVGQHPTARFVFLTLTQKNVPVGELRHTLRGMNQAWGRLSQRKRFRVVLGWIRTTEVTRGNDGTAHPHFHVLLLVHANYFTKNYIAHAQWVEMWRRALRVNYSPVMHIRKVKGLTRGRGDTLAGVRETLKYSVKPSDMKADVPWFLEITRQLQSLRFIASGGVLKDVLRPDEESQEDLLLLRESEPSDEKASVFFGWKAVQKRYKRAR